MSERALIRARLAYDRFEIPLSELARIYAHSGRRLSQAMVLPLNRQELEALPNEAMPSVKWIRKSYHCTATGSGHHALLGGFNDEKTETGITGLMDFVRDLESLEKRAYSVPAPNYWNPSWGPWDPRPLRDTSHEIFWFWLRPNPEVRADYLDWYSKQFYHSARDQKWLMTVDQRMRRVERYKTDSRWYRKLQLLLGVRSYRRQVHRRYIDEDGDVVVEAS